MIIGVMGMSGSGKSTFSDFLKELGAELIDADKIAREVMEKDSEGFLEAVKVFGEEILFPDGELNRKKLGSIVFSDKEKLEKLNFITSSRIDAIIKKRAFESKAKNIVIDCPMLYKISAYEICDKVIFITADKEIMADRIMKRDSLSYVDAIKRINSQGEEFSKYADIIIENNKDADYLKSCAIKIISGKDEI